MPFGNMDSDKIEARKGLLETFLKVNRFLFEYIDFRQNVTLQISACFNCKASQPVFCPLFQQLCNISEIANSEEMQEFLALNTDARIAFVKKPFIVSRIDKVCALIFHLIFQTFLDSCAMMFVCQQVCSHSSTCNHHSCDFFFFILRSW